MVFLFLVLVCVLILYSLSQGAPYVPTRTKEANEALDMMDVPKGVTIVDVGAGDGAVLKVAAERGYLAVGIEMNPILWLVAWLRTRKFGGRVTVVLGNAWRWHLPIETKSVFLFTAGPFAGRMGKWLRSEQKRLGAPLVVVSHGFHLPGEKVAQKAGACIKYVLE